MPKFRFVNTTTITDTRWYEVTADTYSKARAKVEVGPIEQVCFKEGVNLYDEKHEISDVISDYEGA